MGKVSGAADGDGGYFDERQAEGDGDPLAGFAAGAAGVGEFELVGDHGDFAEDVGSVADDVDVFDGSGEFSVFDEVAAFDVEGEIAGADHDLAIGEDFGVESFFDALEDFFFFVGSGEHVGVSHAGYGGKAEGLASTVAGGGDAVVFGADGVVHIVFEDAVLDEDGVLAGVAFVVDVNGAALVWDGGVVDDGDEFVGDFVADVIAEDGDAFAVGVGFQAVSYGFVEEDAGAACAEDHGHFAALGFDGLEELEGALDGFVGEGVGVVEVEGLGALSGGEPAEVGFALVVLLGGAAGGGAHHGLAVGGAESVGAADEDVVCLVGEGDVDFDDAVVEGEGVLVGSL